MKIIRLKKVLEQTGLGRSTLYKLIAAGAFPVQVSLGNSRSVGWVAEEVDAWVLSRMEARDILASPVSVGSSISLAH